MTVMNYIICAVICFMFGWVLCSMLTANSRAEECERCLYKHNAREYLLKQKIEEIRNERGE